MRVLDLGCGRANTSLFLARTFDVKVIALDLWIAADDILHIARSARLEDSVLPLNMDVTQRLPFADRYFDLVFCMDAFHYFGANPGFLAHIGKHLRPGGYLVVGNPCFDREFSGPPPYVYEPPWSQEFSKYHSPAWWKDLFERSALFDSVQAEEPANGMAYWEDDVLHALSSGSAKDLAQLENDAAQIVFGRDNPQHPRLTHYILSCKRRMDPNS
jgi:SAM-dependent methyltransferase